MADITIDQRWGIKDVTDVVSTINLNCTRGSLFNTGSNVVYASMNQAGALARDDVENVGEIPIAAGDSIPIPASAKFVRVQCKAAETSKLVVIPDLT